MDEQERRLRLNVFDYLVQTEQYYQAQSELKSVFWYMLSVNPDVRVTQKHKDELEEIASISDLAEKEEKMREIFPKVDCARWSD